MTRESSRNDVMIGMFSWARKANKLSVATRNSECTMSGTPTYPKYPDPHTNTNTRKAITLMNRTERRILKKDIQRKEKKKEKKRSDLE